MLVEEVNVKCWNCGTEFTTSYEIGQETINQGIDKYGNTISLKTNDPRLVTISVGIKCPNPECGKRNLKPIKVPR